MRDGTLDNVNLEAEVDQAVSRFMDLYNRYPEAVSHLNQAASDAGQPHSPTVLDDAKLNQQLSDAGSSETSLSHSIILHEGTRTAMTQVAEKLGLDVMSLLVLDEETYFVFKIPESVANFMYHGTKLYQSSVSTSGDV